MDIAIAVNILLAGVMVGFAITWAARDIVRAINDNTSQIICQRNDNRKYFG